MLIKQITFSFAIAFISWIVGMLLNAFLAKTTFYQPLTHLNFIKNEKLNKLLGLNVFKYILLHSFFKFFNPKLSMKKKIKASELNEYRKEMTAAELNHLLASGFMNVFIFIKIFKGLYLFALVITLVNLLMNIYPVLLQQQNKRRIDKYLTILTLRSRLL
ncbi:hypothetical protein G7074_11475 [Pedobacter sp. HDW13]|uniref:glycosyl-4,4'-diaponeurosporenoate acyltransferase CrtO family protein n=1 Tax=Pedobacter sp. HDW13 TaxID=2714940 RepID=UPI00140AD5B7|nr:hypothetical protein [Pedobacter sp. HDW13]QIL39830.1 hypothetical protein G7074_11475 [Pedobacter sp. HDW13]